MGGTFEHQVAIIDAWQNRDLLNRIYTGCRPDIGQDKLLVSLISIAKVGNKHLWSSLLTEEGLKWHVFCFAQHCDRLLRLVL